MHHLVGDILAHLQGILQHGGYWIIAIVTIAESLPLFGTIVPGHTIIILGGAFAKLGYLNLTAVFFIAIGGAIIGDCLAYAIGKKYGLGIIVRWGKYFLVKQQHIDTAKDMLHRHTGKALIAGRLSPVTRAFIPFLAGAGGISKKKFFAYTIVSGILWSGASVLIGYVFGASYHLAAQYIGRYTTIGVVIIILIILAYHFINTRRHIFAKYDLHVLLVCLPALYVFFSNLEDVVSYRPFMALLDVKINGIMAMYQTSWFETLMHVVSNVLSPTVLSVLVLVGLVWWIWKRHWHNVAVIVAVYPTGIILGYLLKNIIERARPLDMVINETGFSFPSGHAVAGALFFSLAITFFARYIRNRHYRELFIAGNVVAIALICFSRLYLNVHWMSDVVGGTAFGVFWATLMILTVRYLEGLTKGRYAKKLHE